MDQVFESVNESLQYIVDEFEKIKNRKKLTKKKATKKKGTK